MMELNWIVGIWRLVTATAVNAGGQTIRPPYGPKPMGQLVLNPDGRMMAVLCDGRNDVSEGETRSYSSYCGNFRLEEGRLVTTVDAASDQTRIGSVQTRALEMREGRLVLLPPRRSDGQQRELIWERIG